MGKSVKRFGARYGVKVRKQIQEIEEKQKRKHLCPSCMSLSVKRISTSIWYCNHCGITYVGGAYTPDV